MNHQKVKPQRYKVFGLGKAKKRKFYQAFFYRFLSFNFGEVSAPTMKKILLLSDTHSHHDDTILKYVAQADEVWHAGDIGDLNVIDAIKLALCLVPIIW